MIYPDADQEEDGIAVPHLTCLQPDGIEPREARISGVVHPICLPPDRKKINYPLTIIPAYRVDAVCEIPWGAHPTEVLGY
jgi:hypothetical protein